MDAIVVVFRHIVAAIAIVPFVTFFGVWFVTFGVTKDKKQSTRVSMDVTFVLLLATLSIMTANVFGSSLLYWFVILLFLLAAAWIGREQNRKYGQVNVVKLLKMLSRLGFFVLSLLYFVLLLIGIARYMTMT
ncbi:DUF3397 domain-containing protein [Paenibacillus sp. MBLB4367]|uniref:DUF3397 domain-containing protein n=1 Tax=Paenibacillus sp. MBLB4367 TaxID=3384767 RepID=UPI003908385C